MLTVFFGVSAFAAGLSFFLPVVTAEKDCTKWVEMCTTARLSLLSDLSAGELIQTYQRKVML